MPDGKKSSIKSPKRSTREGTNPNGFTTERRMYSERRSIRHFNDGHVSQRDANYRCCLPGTIKNQHLSKAKDKTMKPSISSNGSSQHGMSIHHNSDYQPPSAFQVAELQAAVDGLFHPEGSSEPRKYTSKDGIPPKLALMPRAVSPSPQSSPELMNTEVFAPPVAPKTNRSNPNSISNQWRAMGVNKVYKDLGYYH